jgi:hypothetical protein
MLGDPDINLTRLRAEQQPGRNPYAYEVCDACEDDSLGYQIDNILLSDFAHSSWFESFRAEGSTQFDRTNKIQAPLQLLAGGYIGTFNVTSGRGGSREHPASLRTRRERRNIPHNLWVNSLPSARS